MPEYDDDLDEIDEASASPAMKRVREHNRRLAADLKAATKLNVEMKAMADRAVQFEREATLAKAGVPDGKLGAMFSKGYDGEWTIEAVKAAWDEIAPTTSATTATTKTNQPTDDEALMADRMAGASAGAFTPDREAAYEAERLAAKNPQELKQVLDKYGITADSQ